MIVLFRVKYLQWDIHAVEIASCCYVYAGNPGRRDIEQVGTHTCTRTYTHTSRPMDHCRRRWGCNSSRAEVGLALWKKGGCFQLLLFRSATQDELRRVHTYIHTHKDTDAQRDTLTQRAPTTSSQSPSLTEFPLSVRSKTLQTALELWGGRGRW